MSALQFDIHATDGMARTGIIRLPRGEIRTPAFMPVGTAGTVKAMMPENVRATGADIVLGNTYHLMLRPGAERVARLGGLHTFMDWPRPILTDSGGFQVMSLSALRKISDEGVVFRSHIDGSEHKLTPERSIEIQSLLGADIQMVLDECVALPAPDTAIEKALALSTRWAIRSKAAFAGEAEQGRALFGIVQGGTNTALRRRAAGEIADIGFDGYALGGLAVGEGHEAMIATLSQTTPHLPASHPRYLMGVGKPRDLVEAVGQGVDMFDCVLPTRSGRSGQAFVRSGALNLKNARHADDSSPLDPSCGCPACARFTRGYLHHLVKSSEILGAMLLTWHNLQYYQDLMAGMRAAISSARFADFTAEFYTGLGTSDDGELIV